MMGEKDGMHVTLREFVERIMDEREKHIETRFSNAQEALTVSKRELDKKLAELNELRREYTSDRTSDQKQYLKQDIYLTKINEYDKWITNADRKITVIETRHITWTAALGVFFIIIQIAFKYFIK